LGNFQTTPSEELDDRLIVLELLLNFAELLLDSSPTLRITDEELLDFAELDDTLVSFSSFDDEDFAFSLLDEFFWTLELEDFVKLLLDSSAFGFRMTDEELFSFFDELLFSTLIGSSSGLTDLSPFSPHAARNNSIK
jgi:hypothetical protein